MPAASPLDALAGAPLNHLLRAHAWARAALQPHAGKTACLRCLPFSVNLQVLESGEVGPAPAGAPADATLSVTPGLLLRIATRDETAWRDIVIDGDTELASAINQLWRHLRWDAEEDLSRVFGDIAAHRMTRSARAIGGWALDSGENLARSFAEYWTEESPLIAPADEVAQFNAEVDRLRDDVARLEKRIDALAAH